MHLQPSEFIALTPTTPQRIATYNMVPGTGTASSCLSMPKRGYPLTHEQLVSRMRADENNLPVILFDPLDTNTDKENNND